MPRLIGVDIGGTNTDLILVDTDAGRLVTAKVPTTAENQAEGLLQGIEALGTTPASVDLLIHGTTVATNAVIERKGARCGLITTAGFRDVLELRRRDRPQTYGLIGSFQPLIERRFRREVSERMSAEGTVLTPLDANQVRAEAKALLDDGCEVVVVCFLHSYANAAHERAARELLHEVWPNDFIVLSSDILPALREFERTSTTVVSGYVQPLIGRYLERLGSRLGEAGYRRDLLVVQSNGGVMAAPVATRLAVNTILSGPAAGVTAASAIATEMKLDEVVSCDMGGTSLDVCLIRAGQPSLTNQKLLDFGIPLCIPMLDVDAIGAGGGSLATIDRAGLLKVGPESAGSRPGPVCAGRGGTVPTVTDANLVLGLLDPDNAIGRGRGMKMDRDLARAAIAETIGKPLGLEPEAAAEAILIIAGSMMAGHVRRKLLEKGLDPRRFSLIAFGGAGPLHANRILREVGMTQAVIPYYPGITSAMGCILGRLRHDFMQTVSMPLGRLDEAALAAVWEEQFDRGRRLMAEEGVTAESVSAVLGADMCYRGQTHVIPVTLPTGRRLDRAAIRAAFEAAYRTRYSQLLDAEPVVVNARTTVFSTAEVPALSRLVRIETGALPEPRRTRVFFGGAWRDAVVHERTALPVGAVIEGPAVLLQADSTSFIEPGYQARVHSTGNILVEAAS
ncbi:MAG: hydantoinase/oxoprolinase family protein [Pseudomonadota bacterium]